MVDVIVIAILLIIAAGAGFYIYKSKKSGAACIGCSCSGQCSKKHNGSCCGTNK